VAYEACQTVSFRRARFSTRLPTHLRYTASHYWLQEAQPGLWRVGFTEFALRMLGELVEVEFETKTAATTEVGQVIGWVESFKAAADIYCAVGGEFVAENPLLRQNIAIVLTDPYGEGWLYAVRGQPDPAAMDVEQYVQVLTATVDKLRSQQDASASEPG
jgi:glycine cleavage system H protein